MTVGIDIGSSGTQVIFSRVNLRRLGEDLSSRYFVVSRETLFQSSVALTPYRSEEHIDEAKLGAIIDDAYNAAGIDPAASTPAPSFSPAKPCGARTPRRSPASWRRRRRFRLRHGGPSHGIDARGLRLRRRHGVERRGQAHPQYRHRRRHHQARGGGARQGGGDCRRPHRRPASGGRHDGLIVRLDPAGKYHAKRAGFAWNRGDVAGASDLDKVADGMADALVAALAARPLPDDIAHLYLTDPIADFGPVDGIMFSGGVGEYLYGREDRDFADLGRRLGHASAGASTQAPCLAAAAGGECIRATALGASEYSVQLSATRATSRRPAPLLPRRNLQYSSPTICLPR